MTKKNPFEAHPYPAKKIQTFPKVSKAPLNVPNFNINIDLPKPLRTYELGHLVQVVLSMPLVWDSTNKRYDIGKTLEAYVTNFPSDYPDALSKADLDLILAQLDSKTSTLFKAGQNIGNTGFNASNLLNPHPVTIPVPTPVSDNAGSLTIDQPTRTNLLVKPERDDLNLIYNTYALGAAADIAILGAQSGIKHKVYACGYTVDAAVRIGFRFNNVDPRFCVRRTAGVFAQTFPNPIVSAANVTLSLRVEGASNGDWWLQYISEA